MLSSFYKILERNFDSDAGEFICLKNETIEKNSKENEKKWDEKKHY